MTRQTAAPLERLSLNVGDREAVGLARMLVDGTMTVDLPYQRGSVWTTDQRVETDDGPYVRYSGLTDIGRRIFDRTAHLPFGTAAVGTVEAEAAIYLRVNGGGTAQTDADMNRAVNVAGGR